MLPRSIESLPIHARRRNKAILVGTSIFALGIKATEKHYRAGIAIAAAGALGGVLVGEWSHSEMELINNPEKYSYKRSGEMSPEPQQAETK